MNTCKSCVYYEPYVGADGAGGDCHRYPPTHPFVAARDWCGEWKANSPAIDLQPDCTECGVKYPMHEVGCGAYGEREVASAD